MVWEEKKKKYPDGTPWWSFPGTPRNRDGGELVGEEEFVENYEYSDGAYVPKEDYSPPVDILEQTYSVYDDPETEDMSYQEPRDQRFKLIDQLGRLDDETIKQKQRRTQLKGFAVRPNESRDEERRLSGERSDVMGDIQSIEDDQHYTNMSLAADEDYAFGEDGEYLNKEGYGEHSRSLEQESANRREVKTPVSFNRPDEIFEKSRETGAPWQEIIIEAYASKNPWLDQHKVRRAVYRAADKHFDKWLKDNKGSPKGYNKHLRGSMSKRGRGGRRGYGGGKKSGSSLARSIMSESPDLSRFIGVLKDAKDISGRVLKKEIGDYESKLGTDENNQIDQSIDHDDVYATAFAKRHNTADAYINQSMRALSDRKDEDKLKHNRFSLQQSSLEMIGEALKARYDSGDKETIELIESKSGGKKPGKPAFMAAANDIFLSYGVDDVSTTQGNRGTKKYKPKTKRGYDPNRKGWGHRD